MISDTLAKAAQVERSAPVANANAVRTSKTWKVDKDKKRILSQFIDDKEALEQGVYFYLHSHNKTTFIHGDAFGAAFSDLYGKSMELVKALVPTRVQECLIWDERIAGVSDFEFEEVDPRVLKVSFNISSIYGDFEQEVEIAI